MAFGTLRIRQFESVMSVLESDNEEAETDTGNYGIAI